MDQDYTRICTTCKEIGGGHLRGCPDLSSQPALVISVAEGLRDGAISKGWTAEDEANWSAPKP